MVTSRLWAWVIAVGPGPVRLGSMWSGILMAVGSYAGSFTRVGGAVAGLHEYKGSSHCEANRRSSRCRLGDANGCTKSAFPLLRVYANKSLRCSESTLDCSEVRFL